VDGQQAGVTTTIGTPIDLANLRHYFAALCLRAGLGYWHPNELDHWAASLMMLQGVPLEVVSEILGHASIRMTKDVYGHIMAPPRQAAADAMGHALWGA
jgi:integrase